jgi:hypothetical protein
VGISNEECYVALLSKTGMQGEAEGKVGALDVGLICVLKRMSRLVEKLIKTEGEAFEIIRDEQWWS